MGKLWLSLIIPVYNEEKRAPAGFAKALRFLARQNYPWELIFVNDGSSDATAATVHRLAASSPSPKGQIYLLSVGQNFGKGHAIRLGAAAARGQRLVFSDIDFSVAPRFIGPLLAHLDHFDVVITSRRLPQSKINRHQSRVRETLGYAFTLLANFLLGLRQTDHTCGLKGLTRLAASRIFPFQNINNWVFDSEILLLAKQNKLTVSELPVTWKNNPHSKVRLTRDIFKSFLALLKLRLTHLPGKL